MIIGENSSKKSTIDNFLCSFSQSRTLLDVIQPSTSTATSICTKEKHPICSKTQKSITPARSRNDKKGHDPIFPTREPLLPPIERKVSNTGKKSPVGLVYKHKVESEKYKRRNITPSIGNKNSPAFGMIKKKTVSFDQSVDVAYSSHQK